MSITNAAANILSKTFPTRVAAESLERAAAEAAKLQAPAMTEAQRIAEKLLKSNVAVVLPAESQDLIALAKVGRLFPNSRRTLSFGNVTKDVQQQGGFAAMVLSDEGKKALANASEAANFERVIDSRLSEGSRFGKELALSVELGLNRDIQHVLIDETEYASFLKTFEEAINKGQAPATVGGKPYTEFFRPSDDFAQEFELAAMRRVVPGFEAKSPEEQKVIASLASAVADEFPRTVHEDTRRRVAATLITHRSVEGQNPGAVLKGLKTFYHGTTVGDRVAKKGFKQIPVFGRNVYGVGTYYGNGSIAADYAVIKSKNLIGKTQIVSGQVDTGAVTTSAVEYAAGKADTRRVPRKELRGTDFGDYFVTSNPKRFYIKGVTTFDPKRQEGFEKLIPDLLDAYIDAPEWAQRYLSRVNSDQAKRAYEHALNSPAVNRRVAASIMLAPQGNAQAIAQTMESLKQIADPQIKRTAYDAAKKGLEALNRTQPEEAGRLMAQLGNVEGKPVSTLQKIYSWMQSTVF